MQFSFINMQQRIIVVILLVTFIGYSASQRASRQKRLVISAPKRLWKDGIIPYVMNNTDLDSKKKINYKEVVFPVFKKYSCIQFVKWNEHTQATYDLNHNNFLKFNNERQCQSGLGNQNKTGQAITCCSGKTCIHEIGHALGLLHEHVSSLRGDFIRVNYDNIVKGHQSQFTISEGANTFGIYDENSIMHYGQKAFSSNQEHTIDFLDPNSNPYSTFADQTRYYYFFMEINAVYNCSASCDLTCANGGYPFKATVDNVCKCQCPEGLNPDDGCESLIDSECGDMIILNETYPTHTFDSPELTVASGHKTCYWFIKSPPNTQIILDFPSFNIKKSNGLCVDEVAVRPYLPGLFGQQYCGKSFHKLELSTFNNMSFSFSKTPSGTSHFVANISYVEDDVFCYNLSTHGVNYNGDMNIGDNNSPCLYWDQVTNCPHHLFNVKDEEAHLEANYCRNPDRSREPWCYTSASDCRRVYCDACKLGPCRDVDGSKTCKKRKANDTTYCTTDMEAPSVCRKKCGFCNGPLESVLTVTCSAPTLPSDAVAMDLGDSYPVDSQLTVNCSANTQDHQIITCMTNGEWSPLKYVCGTCMPGWTGYGSNCYKLFREDKKKNPAKEACNAQCDNCTLLTIPDNGINAFIMTLVKEDTGVCKKIWMGMSNVSVSADGTELEWQWDDGSTSDFENWSEDSARSEKNKCAAWHKDCLWYDRPCTGSTQKFICQYPKNDRVVCMDQRDDCADIKARKKNFCSKYSETFAQTFCAATCNKCG